MLVVSTMEHCLILLARTIFSIFASTLKTLFRIPETYIIGSGHGRVASVDDGWDGGSRGDDSEDDEEFHFVVCLSCFE